MAERLSTKIGVTMLIASGAGIAISFMVDLAVFALRGRDPKIAATIALGIWHGWRHGHGRRFSARSLAGPAMTGELRAGDALPPGPYAVGMTKGPRGETAPPWTVTCGTGQAVAGHVPSREIAEALAFALNMLHPAERPGRRLP